MKKSLYLILAVILLAMTVQCTTGNKKVDIEKYSKTTQELIEMVEGDTAFKRLLLKSIDIAWKTNPDKTTNPVENLEDYYDFVEWSVKAMPWSVYPMPKGTPLYNKIDQSLIYCYYMCDVPLEELEGKGLYNNSIQYIEPYRTWLIDYAKNWGAFLSTPESWNEDY